MVMLGNDYHAHIITKADVDLIEPEELEMIQNAASQIVFYHLMFFFSFTGFL